jgi:putative transposase
LWYQIIKKAKMSTPTQNKEKRRSYPSDMSKNGWKKLQKPLQERLNSIKKIKEGRPSADLKEVINAIFYIVKSGCAWRMLPHDFPNWNTVYGYYNRWSKDGTWEFINAWFVAKLRERMNKKKNPSAAIIDSQSVKHTAVGSESYGFDGGKKVTGIKRFILTDSQGLLLMIMVCAASVSEKAGAMDLIRRIMNTKILKWLCSRIKLVWADGGYQGQELSMFARGRMNWKWQVVKRNDEAKGFEVIPRRWVVERTFGWLSHNRRLSKNYEFNTKNSESMVYIASIRLMMARF